MSLQLDVSAWKRVAFGDVIDSITDRVDNPSEAGVDRYVGLEHLDPGVMTIKRWDSPDKVDAQKLRFQPNDVIFGRRRAYQKKVAKAEFEGICSAHALVLRARPDYVDPGFLPVFLSSDYFLDRAIEISVGSLSPTVNWRDLKVQEFDFPPLDEQKRIADLLWAIERHKRALAAVAGAAAGDQLQDPRTARSALLSHLLASAAETWGTRRLGDIGSLTRGKRFTKADYVDVGIPCIHYGQIYTAFDEVATEAVTFLPEDLRPTLKFAQPGDVVISGTSETIEDVAKAVAWLGSEPVAVHDDCFIFSHDLDPKFASFLFGSEAFTRQKTQFRSETKVVRITGGNLARIAVAVPPLTEQERIAQAVEQLALSKEAITVEEAKLSTIWKSLMSEIFGGN